MEEFARQIDSQLLHSTVVNETGLTGKYDFVLHFDAAADAPDAEFTGPDFKTAMRQQLGLILRETKGPAEVIVIDSMDREAVAN